MSSKRISDLFERMPSIWTDVLELAIAIACWVALQWLQYIAELNILPWHVVLQPVLVIGFVSTFLLYKQIARWFGSPNKPDDN